jgi:hypothetical protein
MAALDPWLRSRMRRQGRKRRRFAFLAFRARPHRFGNSHSIVPQEFGVFVLWLE